jgi:hypothetical protein
LPDVDRRALAARQAGAGYRERLRLAYRQGVDGWIDDWIAVTRPWGFALSGLTTPTSSGTDRPMCSHRETTTSTCWPASSEHDMSSAAGTSWSDTSSLRRVDSDALVPR